MAQVGKLSASKITTYKGCGLAYYIRYIAHERIASNARLVFGKEIHYMLEQFYKKNFKSEDSFVNSWKFRWFSIVAGNFLRGKEKQDLQTNEVKVNEDFILKVGSHVDFGREEDIVGLFFGYKKLGENILRRFYRRHIIEKTENSQGRNRPFAIELAFGNKKDEPLEIGGHLVRGVFDRIDRKGDDWYITDYKTDKSTPGTDAFTLHRHPQFTIYSYAFRQILGVNEKAILYYHLRTGDVFKTHRSEPDFEYIKRLIDEVAEGITKNVFVPFYGFHCNMCDGKVACEKYSIPHHGGPQISLENRIIGAEKFEGWDETKAPDWMLAQEEDR